MPKKKSKSRKKLAVIILAVLFLVVLLVFGARIFLYINVLIGNDLIIKLNADKESLTLANGESGKINFNIYTLSNIFCETQCSSKFIGLSDDIIIEEDNFKTRIPKTKEYEIFAPEYGIGTELFRFDIECNSPETFLCKTNGKTKKSSVLITLNYNLNKEQESLKNNLKNKLESYFTKQDYIISSLTEFNNTIRQLSKTLKTPELSAEFSDISDSLYENNKSNDELLDLWRIEKYSLLNENFERVNLSFDKIETRFISLNNSINNNLDLYNSLIDNMTETKNLLEDMKNFNFSYNPKEEFSNLVREYNNLQLIFSVQDIIQNKAALVLNISNRTISFYNQINKTHINSSSALFNVKIYEFNYSKIYPNNINISSYALEEPISIFCFDHQCQNACDDGCYENPEKYPIIFLHGHSFNEKVSAEASLNSFEDIQRKLEDNNYLNAGSLFLTSQKNSANYIWSNIPMPLTIKASYYFDILSNEGKNIIIETKTDNLDTYTLRLKDIIEEVKSKTNRKKVIIIAHSMGGLIGRRYLQVFGEGDIEKLILISTPNKGISGSTLDFCPLFGTKLECNDMDKNSLFISKLNNAEKPILPVYNIITIGCRTNGEDGDGVIANSSQYLKYAKNYYINGTCYPNQFKYLHNDVLDPEKYPETLNLIRQFLNDSLETINLSS